MSAAAQGKNCGDWLLQFLTAQGVADSLGLVYLGWGKRRSQEPVYPTNPYSDCPRVDLYLDEEQIGPLPSGQNTTDAAYSLWYKRRHTRGVGDNQQTLVAADVETIINLFLGEWRPTELDGHSNVKVYGVFPNSPTRFHPDLHHEFDDPAIRVSVAEISLIIRSRSA